MMRRLVLFAGMHAGPENEKFPRPHIPGNKLLCFCVKGTTINGIGGAFFMQKKLFVCLTIALAVLMVLPMALAERSLAVSTENSTLLVSENGTLLTRIGDYSSLYSISPEDCPEERALFAASTTDSIVEVPYTYETGDGTAEGVDYVYMLALMDKNGKSLTDYIYLTLVHFPQAGRVAGARADGAMDLMDEQGNILFSGNYGVILPTSSSTYLAVRADPANKDEYGYPEETGALVALDAAGNATETGYLANRYSLYQFTQGLAPILVYDESGDAWIYRYFRADGALAMDSAYGYAEAFQNGYAIVSSLENGMYGLIDVQGNWALNPDFSLLSSNTSFEKPPIIAQKGDAEVTFFNIDTLQPIFTYRGADGDYAFGGQPNEGLLCVYSGSNTFLYNLEGEQICRMEDSQGYLNASYYYNLEVPQALVVSSGEWPNASSCIVDLNGNTLSKDFRELTGLCWQNGHGLYIAATYETISYEYEGQVYYDTDYETYRVGLVDETGAEVLPLQYSSLTPLSPNRFWVTQDELYGMIDAQGNWYCQFNVYSELQD